MHAANRAQRRHQQWQECNLSPLLDLSPKRSRGVMSSSTAFPPSPGAFYNAPTPVAQSCDHLSADSYCVDPINSFTVTASPTHSMGNSHSEFYNKLPYCHYHQNYFDNDDKNQQKNNSNNNNINNNSNQSVNLDSQLYPDVILQPLPLDHSPFLSGVTRFGGLRLLANIPECRFTPNDLSSLDVLMQLWESQVTYQKKVEENYAIGMHLIPGKMPRRLSGVKGKKKRQEKGTERKTVFGKRARSTNTSNSVLDNYNGKDNHRNDINDYDYNGTASSYLVKSDARPAYKFSSCPFYVLLNAWSTICAMHDDRYFENTNNSNVVYSRQNQWKGTVVYEMMKNEGCCIKGDASKCVGGGGLSEQYYNTNSLAALHGRNINIINYDNKNNNESNIVEKHIINGDHTGDSKKIAEWLDRVVSRCFQSVTANELLHYAPLILLAYNNREEKDSFWNAEVSERTFQRQYQYIRTSELFYDGCNDNNNNAMNNNINNITNHNINNNIFMKKLSSRLNLRSTGEINDVVTTRVVIAEIIDPNDVTCAGNEFNVPSSSEAATYLPSITHNETLNFLHCIKATPDIYIAQDDHSKLTPKHLLPHLFSTHLPRSYPLKRKMTIVRSSLLSNTVATFLSQLAISVSMVLTQIVRNSMVSHCQRELSIIRLQIKVIKVIKDIVTLWQREEELIEYCLMGGLGGGSIPFRSRQMSGGGGVFVGVNRSDGVRQNIVNINNANSNGATGFPKSVKFDLLNKDTNILSVEYIEFLLRRFKERESLVVALLDDVLAGYKVSIGLPKVDDDGHTSTKSALDDPAHVAKCNEMFEYINYFVSHILLLGDTTEQDTEEYDPPDSKTDSSRYNSTSSTQRNKSMSKNDHRRSVKSSFIDNEWGNMGNGIAVEIREKDYQLFPTYKCKIDAACKNPSCLLNNILFTEDRTNDGHFILEEVREFASTWTSVMSPYKSNSITEREGGGCVGKQGMLEGMQKVGIERYTVIDEPLYFAASFNRSNDNNSDHQQISSLYGQRPYANGLFPTWTDIYKHFNNNHSSSSTEGVQQTSSSITHLRPTPPPGGYNIFLPHDATSFASISLSTPSPKRERCTEHEGNGSNVKSQCGQEHPEIRDEHAQFVGLHFMPSAITALHQTHRKSYLLSEVEEELEVLRKQTAERSKKKQEKQKLLSQAQLFQHLQAQNPRTVDASVTSTGRGGNGSPNSALKENERVGTYITCESLPGPIESKGNNVNVNNSSKEPRGIDPDSQGLLLNSLPTSLLQLVDEIGVQSVALLEVLAYLLELKGTLLSRKNERRRMGKSTSVPSFSLEGSSATTAVVDGQEEWTGEGEGALVTATVTDGTVTNNMADGGSGEVTMRRDADRVPAHSLWEITPASTCSGVTPMEGCSFPRIKHVAGNSNDNLFFEHLPLVSVTSLSNAATPAPSSAVSPSDVFNVDLHHNCATFTNSHINNTQQPSNNLSYGSSSFALLTTLPELPPLPYVPLSAIYNKEHPLSHCLFEERVLPSHKVVAGKAVKGLPERIDLFQRALLSLIFDVGIIEAEKEENCSCGSGCGTGVEGKELSCNKNNKEASYSPFRGRKENMSNIIDSNNANGKEDGLGRRLPLFSTFKSRMALLANGIFCDIESRYFITDDKGYSCMQRIFQWPQRRGMSCLSNSSSFIAIHLNQVQKLMRHALVISTLLNTRPHLLYGLRINGNAKARRLEERETNLARDESNCSNANINSTTSNTTTNSMFHPHNTTGEFSSIVFDSKKGVYTLVMTSVFSIKVVNLHTFDESRKMGKSMKKRWLWIMRPLLAIPRWCKTYCAILICRCIDDISYSFFPCRERVRKCKRAAKFSNKAITTKVMKKLNYNDSNSIKRYCNKNFVMNADVGFSYLQGRDKEVSVLPFIYLPHNLDGLKDIMAQERQMNSRHRESAIFERKGHTNFLIKCLFIVFACMVLIELLIGAISYVFTSHLRLIIIVQCFVSLLGLSMAALFLMLGYICIMSAHEYPAFFTNGVQKKGLSDPLRTWKQNQTTDISLLTIAAFFLKKARQDQQIEQLENQVIPALYKKRLRGGHSYVNAFFKAASIIHEDPLDLHLQHQLKEFAEGDEMTNSNLNTNRFALKNIDALIPFATEKFISSSAAQEISTGALHILAMGCGIFVRGPRNNILPDADRSRSVGSNLTAGSVFNAALIYSVHRRYGGWYYNHSVFDVISNITLYIRECENLVRGVSFGVLWEGSGKEGRSVLMHSSSEMGMTREKMYSAYSLIAVPMPLLPILVNFCPTRTADNNNPMELKRKIVNMTTKETEMPFSGGTTRVFGPMNDAPVKETTSSAAPAEKAAQQCATAEYKDTTDLVAFVHYFIPHQAAQSQSMLQQNLQMLCCDISGNNSGTNEKYSNYFCSYFLFIQHLEYIEHLKKFARVSYKKDRQDWLTNINNSSSGLFRDIARPGKQSLYACDILDERVTRPRSYSSCPPPAAKSGKGERRRRNRNARDTNTHVYRKHETLASDGVYSITGAESAQSGAGSHFTKSEATTTGKCFTPYSHVSLYDAQSLFSGITTESNALSIASYEAGTATLSSTQFGFLSNDIYRQYTRRPIILPTGMNGLVHNNNKRQGGARVQGSTSGYEISHSRTPPSANTEGSFNVRKSRMSVGCVERVWMGGGSLPYSSLSLSTQGMFASYRTWAALLRSAAAVVQSSCRGVATSQFEGPTIIVSTDAVTKSCADDGLGNEGGVGGGRQRQLSAVTREIFFKGSPLVYSLMDVKISKFFVEGVRFGDERLKNEHSLSQGKEESELGYTTHREQPPLMSSQFDGWMLLTESKQGGCLGGGNNVLGVSGIASPASKQLHRDSSRKPDEKKSNTNGESMCLTVATATTRQLFSEKYPCVSLANSTISAGSIPSVILQQNKFYNVTSIHDDGYTHSFKTGRKSHATTSISSRADMEVAGHKSPPTVNSTSQAHQERLTSGGGGVGRDFAQQQGRPSHQDKVWIKTSTLHDHVVIIGVHYHFKSTVSGKASVSCRVKEHPQQSNDMFVHSTAANITKSTSAFKAINKQRSLRTNEALSQPSAGEENLFDETPDWTVFYWNNAAARATGFESSEVVGRSLKLLLAHEFGRYSGEEEVSLEGISSYKHTVDQWSLESIASSLEQQRHEFETIDKKYSTRWSDTPFMQNLNSNLHIDGSSAGSDVGRIVLLSRAHSYVTIRCTICIAQMEISSSGRYVHVPVLIGTVADETSLHSIAFLHRHLYFSLVASISTMVDEVASRASKSAAHAAVISLVGRILKRLDGPEGEEVPSRGVGMGGEGSGGSNFLRGIDMAEWKRILFSLLLNPMEKVGTTNGKVGSGGQMRSNNSFEKKGALVTVPEDGVEGRLVSANEHHQLQHQSQYILASLIPAALHTSSKAGKVASLISLLMPYQWQRLCKNEAELRLPLHLTNPITMSLVYFALIKQQKYEGVIPQGFLEQMFKERKGSSTTIITPSITEGTNTKNSMNNNSKGMDINTLPSSAPTQCIPPAAAAAAAFLVPPASCNSTAIFLPEQIKAMMRESWSPPLFLLKDTLNSLRWPQFLLQCNRIQRFYTHLLSPEELLGPALEFCRSSPLNASKQLELDVLIDASVSRKIVCDAVKLRAGLLRLVQEICKHQTMIYEARKLEQHEASERCVSTKGVGGAQGDSSIISGTSNDNKLVIVLIQKQLHESPQQRRKSWLALPFWSHIFVPSRRGACEPLLDYSKETGPFTRLGNGHERGVFSGGVPGTGVGNPFTRSGSNSKLDQFVEAGQDLSLQGDGEVNAVPFYEFNSRYVKDSDPGFSNEVSDLTGIVVRFQLPRGNTFVWQDYHNAYFFPEEFSKAWLAASKDVHGEGGGITTAASAATITKVVGGGRDDLSRYDVKKLSEILPPLLVSGVRSINDEDGLDPLKETQAYANVFEVVNSMARISADTTCKNRANYDQLKQYFTAYNKKKEMKTKKKKLAGKGDAIDDNNNNNNSNDDDEGRLASEKIVFNKGWDNSGVINWTLKLLMMAVSEHNNNIVSQIDNMHYPTTPTKNNNEDNQSERVSEIPFSQTQSMFEIFVPITLSPVEIQNSFVPLSVSIKQTPSFSTHHGDGEKAIGTEESTGGGEFTRFHLQATMDPISTVIVFLQPDLLLASHYIHYFGCVKTHAVVACNNIEELLWAVAVKSPDIIIISERCITRDSDEKKGSTNMSYDSFFKRFHVDALESLGIEKSVAVAPMPFFLALTRHFNSILVWAVNIIQHNNEIRKVRAMKQRLTSALQGGEAKWQQQRALMTLPEIPPPDQLSIPHSTFLLEGPSARRDGSWIIDENLSFNNESVNYQTTPDITRSCTEDISSPVTSSAPSSYQESGWQQLINALATKRHTKQLLLQRHDYYTVTEILGKGTSGIVYKATDRVTGGVVAMKIIKGNRYDNGSGIAALLVEIETMSGLRHHNIVCYISARRGEEKGTRMDEDEYDESSIERRDKENEQEGCYDNNHNNNINNKSENDKKGGDKVLHCTNDVNEVKWEKEESAKGYQKSRDYKHKLLQRSEGDLWAPKSLMDSQRKTPSINLPPLSSNDLCVVMEYCDSSAENLLLQANEARSFSNFSDVSLDYNYADDPLPLPRVFSIICQLLDAVVFLHHKHIVHHDIKPANFLIKFSEVQEAFRNCSSSPTGSSAPHGFRGVEVTDVVKLSDFGSVAVDTRFRGYYTYDSLGSRSSSTMNSVMQKQHQKDRIRGSPSSSGCDALPQNNTNSPVGTLRYMAPEVLCGWKLMVHKVSANNNGPENGRIQGSNSSQQHSTDASGSQNASEEDESLQGGNEPLLDSLMRSTTPYCNGISPRGYDKEYVARCDIWSVGMSLAELLFIVPHEITHCREVYDFLHLYERYRNRYTTPHFPRGVVHDCPFYPFFCLKVPELVTHHVHAAIKHNSVLAAAFTEVYNEINNESITDRCPSAVDKTLAAAVPTPSLIEGEIGEQRQLRKPSTESPLSGRETALWESVGGGDIRSNSASNNSLVQGRSPVFNYNHQHSHRRISYGGNELPHEEGGNAISCVIGSISTDLLNLLLWALADNVQKRASAADLYRHPLWSNPYVTTWQVHYYEHKATAKKRAEQAATALLQDYKRNDIVAAATRTATPIISSKVSVQHPTFVPSDVLIADSPRVPPADNPPILLTNFIAFNNLKEEMGERGILPELHESSDAMPSRCDAHVYTNMWNGSTDEWTADLTEERGGGGMPESSVIDECTDSSSFFDDFCEEEDEEEEDKEINVSVENGTREEL